MSRLSNKFFTGGVQNRVQSSVRDPGASAFSATTVLPATPTVRPTSSSRRGTTFAGSVAGALPNASPNEQTFGAVQNTGPGRDTFGKRGERAANQDVKNYNAIAESFNANATSAKQAEIQAYEQEVARLNSQYDTSVSQYNTQVGNYNTARDAVERANSLADQINEAAAIYRSTGQKPSNYDYLVNQHLAVKNSIAGNELFSGQSVFDTGGQTIQYGSPIAVNAKDVGIVSPQMRYQFGDVTGYTGMSPVYTNSPTYQDFLQAGGTPPRRSSSIGVSSSGPLYAGVLGQAAYNPWSQEVYNKYSPFIQGKDTPNTPYVFGSYDSAADQYGWYSLPENGPERPSFPDAPSTIVEQRQMQEMLPDVAQRQLATGQREVIGGSLPPQVAKTTGSTFSQQNINYGSTPLREISQLNAAEQQRLGAPTAYRVNSGYVAAPGKNTSYGGQTFTPDQITNQSSTHYYIPGIGWTAKSSLTPLYN